MKPAGEAGPMDRGPENQQMVGTSSPPDICNVAVFAFGGGLSVLAQTSTNRTGLKEYSDIFTQEQAKIEAESRKEAESLPGRYIAALTALDQDFRKSGDLEGVLAVKGERDRFSSGKTLTEAVLVTQPDRLRLVQEENIRAMAAIVELRAEKLVALMAKYLAVLENLKKTFTMQEKIQDALLVKKEIETVQVQQYLLAETLKAKLERAAQATNGVVAGTVASVTADAAGLDVAGRNLLLYFPFNADEGASVRDKSGKNRTAKVHGAKWTKTQDGRNGVYYFDGRDDYLDVDDSFTTGNGNFTVSVWVMADGFDSWIDDVMVFSRALTDEEVEKLYSTQKRPEVSKKK